MNEAQTRRYIRRRDTSRRFQAIRPTYQQFSIHGVAHHCNLKKKSNETVNEPLNEPVTDGETEHVREHVREHVCEQVERIVLACRSEVRYLVRALDGGFLERTESGTRAPSQKYRLTESGRKLAHDLEKKGSRGL